MRGFDFIVSLLILLPKVIVLALFPPWIYRVLGHQARARSFGGGGAGRVLEAHSEPSSMQGVGHAALSPLRSGPVGSWTALAGMVLLAALVLYVVSGPLFLLYSIDPQLDEHFYNRVMVTSINPLYVVVFLALVGGAPLLARSGPYQ